MQPISGKKLSIVIPLHNETESVKLFAAELQKVIKQVITQFHLRVEVVYVDDGSTDRTVEDVKALQFDEASLRLIKLSRNFGKEIALTAGLDHTTGDAVVMMDGDLQHPPQTIIEFITLWEEGFDVVYGVRNNRNTEGFFKKKFSQLFYGIMKLISPVPIPAGAGDFRLMSRKAVDALLQARENNRFMKGLYGWVGFSQKALTYEVRERQQGHSRWSFLQLFQLAISAITSFSIVPLQISSVLGIVTAVLGFVLMVWVILEKLFWGSPSSGYPTLMVAILVLGSLQLVMIGILGAYVGQILKEVKKRPLYIVDEITQIPKMDSN